MDYGEILECLQMKIRSFKFTQFMNVRRMPTVFVSDFIETSTFLIVNMRRLMFLFEKSLLDKKCWSKLDL